MKTLILNIVLLIWTISASSQEIVELDETRISFAPYSSQITNNGNQYFFKVSESYCGEFEKDPLSFMKKNFDAHQFITGLKDKNIHSYQVNFVTRKGSLKIDLDKEGKVVKTYQRFKNIKLPNDLSHEIYRNYKGWNIVTNIHIATGRDGRIDKEFYRLKLENGSKTQRIKIDRTEATPVELAIN